MFWTVFDSIIISRAIITKRRQSESQEEARDGLQIDDEKLSMFKWRPSRTSWWNRTFWIPALGDRLSCIARRYFCICETQEIVQKKSQSKF